MITIKQWQRPTGDDGEPTTTEVTFGQAVNHILTLYVEFEEPHVGAGRFSICYKF